ncbi:predicted protein [Naegleria gruberi]|uniref:Predicted protein n=1 Tax=Naegleria gruberi TaxID=5762 RepID=D2VSU6_NAEGR|nr:uncharacterized protein NAEGRDRAFT_72065 [Naegleria gruberi]EFC40180.1 predicted protein [Naegleria gruberi]|eukprot:XP_002672924.1 predicted protein [Naegleria gruberi strain NEG-M]
MAYNRALQRTAQTIRQSFVHGSQSEWNALLSMRCQALSTALAESTVKKYSSTYSEFSYFCLLHNLDKSDFRAPELFACYLAVHKKLYRLNNLKPTLDFYSNLEGWSVNYSNQFSRIKQGLNKFYSRADIVKRKRSGISALNVKQFIDRISIKDSYLHMLSCAILSVGIRLLARPGQLANLSWSCVKLDTPFIGWVTFDLSGHKTDQYLTDEDG